MLDAPTWRANPDWGAQLGYSAESLDGVNRRGVELLEEVRAAGAADGTTVVVSGAVGPRGDAYRADNLMTAEEAEAYHRPQIEAFAYTAADLVTALTLAYPEEGVGIARASHAADIPCVISFTVEVDGRLPSGATLRDAIARVDDETDGAPRTTWSTVPTRRTSRPRSASLGRGRSGSEGSAPMRPRRATPSSTTRRSSTPAIRRCSPPTWTRFARRFRT